MVSFISKLTNRKTYMYMIYTCRIAFAKEKRQDGRNLTKLS